MNKNTVAFVASLVALFAGYFYLNYHFAMKDKAPATATPAAQLLSASTPAPTAPAPSGVEAVTSAATASSATAGTPGASGSPVTETSPAPAIDALPPLLTAKEPADLRVDLPYGSVSFSPKGGCVGQLELVNYRESAISNQPADLFSGYALCKAFGVRLGTSDLREADVGIERLDAKRIRLTSRAPGDVDIVRTWDFGSRDYTASLQIDVINRGKAAVTAPLGLELGATSEHRHSGGVFSGHAIEYRNVAFWFDDKVTREHLVFESTPAREEIFRKNAFLPAWVSSESIYWMAALLPEHRDALDLSVLRTGYNIQKSAGSEDARTIYDAWLEAPVNLQAGQTKSFAYKAYLGPKQRDLLEAAYPDRTLGDAIDFGFFRIVALPMYHALRWLNGLLGNWGVAIILLTLAIKVLFYPLMVKAYIAGKKMQTIQPQLNALKETHKDDRARQQQEMMALMSKQGVNPMSGCLPVLPQIPVFFGLNAVLTHTFELRHAPFFGWIQDLSSRDPYFISPVLMAVLMYVQQKLTPMPSMEPAQQKMMQILPLVFAVFMLSYPSGLVVYIITNSVVSLLQQQYMMRRYKDV